MEEKEYLEELRNQDWDSIILRSTNYVSKRLGTFELVKGSKQFARGSTAQDVTFKAIELLFVGERKWNKNIHLELYQHIISTINSLLYEHFHSFEKERRTIIHDSINEIEPDSFWDKIISDSSPQNLLEYDEVKNECLKIVENEPELADLFLYIIAGYDRKNIAEIMNRSITEIDNLKKRLKRKLNSELSVRKARITK